VVTRIAKSGVSNRAGLVAHAISEASSGAATLASRADTDPRILLAQVARDLEGFRVSQFLVTVTLGRDPVFAFMNDAAGLAIAYRP
jgi:hypothetical protein